MARPEKAHDVQEVINYRHALRLGQEQLRSYPITLPFVRQIHKILLDSVRGENKDPDSSDLIRTGLDLTDVRLKMRHLSP